MAASCSLSLLHRTHVVVNKHRMQPAEFGGVDMLTLRYIWWMPTSGIHKRRHVHIRLNLEYKSGFSIEALISVMLSVYFYSHKTNVPWYSSGHSLCPFILLLTGLISFQTAAALSLHSQNPFVTLLYLFPCPENPYYHL